MIKGFREFILRGNVVDLAVGIVIGIAFGTVITAVVNGLINPLVAAIFGKQNLNEVLTFTINNAYFSIGLILTAVINFVLVAAAVYFVVVIPVNKLRARFDKPVEQDTGPTEVELLTEIRDSLRSRG
jgi:large conductance mechanosensitive channel